MKFNTILNNFSAGAWSQKMISRADTEEYFKACETLENMIPQLQGGAFRRPGTSFQDLTSTYNSIVQTSVDHRIIPFRLSNGNRYLLVANNSSPTAVGNEWFVWNVDTGTSVTLTCPLSSNVADANIETAQFAQVGDLIYYVTDGIAPRIIYTPSSGVFSMIPFHAATVTKSGTNTNQWERVPYQPISADSIDGTITVTGASFAVGNTVQLTSSYSRWVTRDGISDSKDLLIGTFVKISSGGTTGVAMIGSITSATIANALVLATIPGAAPLVVGAAAGTSFEVAAWSGARGWPKTIVPYEQRIYYGGNTSYPDTIWGTRAGNIFDLMEIPFQQDADFATFTTDNARPWSAAIAISPETYEITAMAASKTLEIHTSRLDIVAYGGNGQILGPLNKQFDSSTSFGAERVQPIRVNNYSTFVQRAGKKVRDTVYSFNEDQYKSGDLMFMAEHYTSGTTIKRLASIELGSTSLLLALTNSGRLFSCSIDRDYKLNAWAEWKFSSAEGATIQDMAVLPKSGGVDSLYLVLTRTVSSLPVTSIEKLNDLFEGTTYDFYGVGDQMIYVDSAMIATNPTSPTASTTHNGLARLNGETVSVIADNYYIGEFTVATGAITLPRAYVKCLIGLKYRSYLKTMPIAAGAQFGTPVNQVKTAAKMIINLYKTLACTFKTSGANDSTEISFRDPSVTGDEVTPVFTGEQVVTLPQYVGRRFQVEFETSDPFPMNITSVVLEGVTND